MLANVRLDDHGIDVTLQPMEDVEEAFEEALKMLESGSTRIQLLTGQMSEAEATRLVGEAFSTTVMVEASVPWSPEEWGVWFSQHLVEFNQLRAVAENPEFWRSWSDGA